MRLLLLLLVGSAFACNSPLLFSGWIVDERSITIDSTYVNGKMAVVGGHGLAFVNMVCPDSAKADTARAKK